MDVFSLRSADGTELYACRQVPESPRGIVFVCHGLGEHIGRYAHFIEAITSHGWGVYAVDLRGHGRSGGRRGHLLAWSDYVADLEALYGQARADGFGSSPWVQLGHSMGGLIAVHTASRHADRLRGLILCSPLLGVAAKVPGWKAMAGRLLSRLFPQISLANELDPGNLSRDPTEVRRYLDDPLVHDRVSARWFTEMNAALTEAHRLAPSLALPLLLLHGSSDEITAPEGSREFAARYAGDADVRFLDGYVHELFHDRGSEMPLAIVIDWLARQVSVAS